MKITLTPIKTAITADAEKPFFVMVRLQQPEDTGYEPLPLNIAVVIDQSGSMQGAPIRAAKDCVRELVKQLSPIDSVAAVAYHENVTTVMPLCSATDARATIDDALQSVTSSGCTDLHAGWLRGAELLAPHTRPDALSRVILLSDGNANRGITNRNEILTQVRALADAGVSTTTVGLGRRFNEVLMTEMGAAGKGLAHYGERAEDLFEAFESELSLLKNLAWRDVRIKVVGPAGTNVINPYPKFDDYWCLPSIAFGSEAWALLEIPKHSVADLASGGIGIKVTVSAIGRDGNTCDIEQSLNPVGLVDKPEFDSLPNDKLVARRLAEIEAAEIQMSARDAARSQNWGVVEYLIRQLQVIAVENPWLAESLHYLKTLLNERDDERMSKELHFKAQAMSQRISSIDESSFSALSESITPAHLRRKVTQGRRTQL